MARCMSGRVIFSILAPPASLVLQIRIVSAIGHPLRRNQLIITRRLSGRDARIFPETSAAGLRLSLRRCSSSLIVLGSCGVGSSPC
jgi:hypothetical protein